MTTKLLYACLSGWTATFKSPLFVSNSGVSSYMPTLKLPSYSTIIGLLGNIVGRDLELNEIKRIGYIFDFEKKEGNIDIEKIKSFSINKKGELQENKGNSNPARREFLVRPQLQLFLENVELFEPSFYSPHNIPSFGRSQDVAWFERLPNGKQYEIIEASEVSQGIVRNTLVPFPQKNAAGIILPLAEYYYNYKLGETRYPLKMRTFQFIDTETAIERSNLFAIPSLDNITIYLHDITEIAK
ncbi:CRISPR-associated protein Cas5 [Agriterribacter sp.]|uniref:CRISPR-associated protein Cas5 n=1 Tax=Agriterribacter sp. TaxID=2821509 RepID=UPI002CBCDB94|nr:CRISPR-associated protein Cas5 [Agriterribacter sp.]HTN08484.1 CRISPR-associated protein Cas5 [Agriterribacter sp.]